MRVQVFEGLLYRSGITDHQYDILFPANRLTDFTKFDHALLHLLIHKFTDLTRPDTGWDNEPEAADKSESACYVRVYLARHAISLVQPPVSYTVYQGILNYARQPLLDLGNERRVLDAISIPKSFGVPESSPHYVGRKDEIEELCDHLLNSKNNVWIIHFNFILINNEYLCLYFYHITKQYSCTLDFLKSSPRQNI